MPILKSSEVPKTPTRGMTFRLPSEKLDQLRKYLKQEISLLIHCLSFRLEPLVRRPTFTMYSSYWICESMIVLC